MSEEADMGVVAIGSSGYNVPDAVVVEVERLRYELRRAADRSKVPSLLRHRPGEYVAGAPGLRAADPGEAAGSPAIYKRLWFSSADHDHMEKLTRYGRTGWVLCAVEPHLHGAYFWLHSVPNTDKVRTP